MLCQVGRKTLTQSLNCDMICIFNSLVLKQHYEDFEEGEQIGGDYIRK